jgi:hypothetical protein
MTCECGYHFVFKPKTDGLTDGNFQAIIKQASKNDTYFFTKNQLYTAFCLKLNKPISVLVSIGIFIVSVFLVIISLMIGRWEIMAIAILLAVVSLTIQFGSPSDTKKFLSRRKFDTLLRRWMKVNKIPKLLENPQLGDPPAQQWQEPDIFDYGVERILVVEHDILVDLFVKNGFHAEQSCLIISANGYPTYLAKRLPELVKKNKNISIFLLHDFSSTGSTLVKKFLDSHKELFKNARILDVGLFREDVKQIKVFKRLMLEKEPKSVPVDAIPYAYLALLFSGSISKGIPFSHLLLEWLDSDGADGGSYG